MVTLTTNMTISLPVILAEKIRFFANEKDIHISDMFRKSVREFMEKNE